MTRLQFISFPPALLSDYRTITAIVEEGVEVEGGGGGGGRRRRRRRRRYTNEKQQIEYTTIALKKLCPKCEQ